MVARFFFSAQTAASGFRSIRLTLYAEGCSNQRVRRRFRFVAQVPSKLELHSEVSDKLRLPATGWTKAASGHEEEQCVLA